MQHFSLDYTTEEKASSIFLYSLRHSTFNKVEENGESS